MTACAPRPGNIALDPACADDYVFGYLTMKSQSSATLSWQAVAQELLRRLTGAEPRISTEQLREAGAEHVAELFRCRIDGLYFVACDIDHPRQRVYRALRAAQLAEAEVIINDLKQHSVEPAVFKGIEVGARHPQAMSGVCEDVDLLVPASDLWSVEKVLYGRGYGRITYAPEKGGWKSIDPREAYHHQAIGYELKPFVKGIRIGPLDDEAVSETKRFPRLFKVHDNIVFALVHFDIHHNILFDFDVAPLLARTTASALGTGRTLCPADHLWFLIHRHYFEVALGAEIRLRVLASIAAMVRDPAMDWDLLVRNTVEQSAAAPCLYWLTFLHRLGAPAISERVLGELRSQLRRSERNFGWQLGRLFDVEEAFPDNLLASMSS